MSNRRLIPVTVLLTAFALLTGLFGSAGAQDTEATPAGDNALVTHPAHIYTGTCDTLGDIVFPLKDVISYDLLDPDQATPVVGMDATPSLDLTSTPVAKAGQTTTVEASLDDILAADHAINIHQSADNMDVYIACGDIAGPPTNGMVAVEITELNDSGYMGRATLVDNGDGTTIVTLDLIYPDLATPGV